MLSNEAASSDPDSLSGLEYSVLDINFVFLRMSSHDKDTLVSNCTWGITYDSEGIYSPEGELSMNFRTCLLIRYFTSPVSPTARRVFSRNSANGPE